MKKTINTLLISILLISFSSVSLYAQEKEGYQFTDQVRLETSSVKDQGSSGTCWCFATTSFLETELIRMGKKEFDLSEMFLVHEAYKKKADKFIRYHGNNNFGQGGQAHDAIHELRQHGIVPEKVYSGLLEGEKRHKHYEMASLLQSFVETLVENPRRRNLSPIWSSAYASILESYMGPLPKTFEYEGETYTPRSFAEELELNPDDYVELTSFSHHPFYDNIILEMPDNWSHDPYYNVPLNELMEVMDYSLEQGYSVVWDGDVSSEGFTHRTGVAVVPEKEDANFEEGPVEEKSIDQEYRQKLFNNFTMTDDHLMHLTGIGEDQNGQKYYLTKNSWGTDSNEYGGFLYMSNPYVRLNTIAIMVHKDAIPEEIAEKLGIE
jgi:bleomycin hydrolase